MNHHGAIVLLGDEGFVFAAEIVAPLGVAALLLQGDDGFVVGDAREGRLGSFELRLRSRPRFQGRGSDG